MRVSKTLDIQLEPEELERLENGEPLHIPIDQEQRLVVHPPGENNA